MAQSKSNEKLPSGFVPMSTLYKQVEAIREKQAHQMRVDAGRAASKVPYISSEKSSSKKP